MDESSNQKISSSADEGSTLKFDWSEGLSSFPGSESDGEVSNTNSNFEVFDAPPDAPPNKRQSCDMEASKAIPLRRKKKHRTRLFPKRPLDAYNLFFIDERTNLKGVSFGDTKKVIGKKWQRLPESERRYYEAMADQENDRYRLEMEEYNRRQNEYRKPTEEEEQNQRRFQRTYSPHMIPAPPSTALPYPPATSAMYPPYHQYAHPHVKFYPSPLLPPHPLSTPHSHHQHHQHQHLHHSTEPTPHVPGEPSDFIPSTGYIPHPTVEGEPDNSTPIPPGMEIMLRDSNGVPRRYRVQYAMVTMDADEAQKHMEQLRDSSEGAWNSAR